MCIVVFREFVDEFICIGSFCGFVGIFGGSVGLVIVYVVNDSF